MKINSVIEMFGTEVSYLTQIKLYINYVVYKNNGNRTILLYMIPVGEFK